MSDCELDTKTIEISNSSFICSVVFLPDGKHIIGGGYDGNVRCWRVEDGREVGTPMIVGHGVLNLVASGDGKWIVNGTDSGLVTVWDAETHLKAMEFGAHPGFPIETLDVSPPTDDLNLGPRIATGSHDATACVWSLRSAGERLIGPLQHDSTLAAVKYSPDGRFLATAACNSYSIRIYHSGDGHLSASVPVMVDSFHQSLVWSKNGKHLFALSDGNVKCLDASTGTTLSEWPIHHNTNPRGIIMSPNERFIAASANSSVSFWDTATHVQIGPVIEHEDVLLSIAISSNYELVTSGVKSTVLRSLRNILPSECLTKVHMESESLHIAEEHDTDLKESVLQSLCTEIRHLRVQQGNSQRTIAKLEETIQSLRAELAESRRKADQQSNDLGIAIERLRSDLRASWTERKYGRRHPHHSRLAATARQEGVGDSQIQR